MKVCTAIFYTLALLPLAGCMSAPGQYANASITKPCNQPMSRTHQRVQAGNLLYTVSEDFSGSHPAITPASNYQTVADYDVDSGGCK